METNPQKVVLVTGASSGIGLATVIYLAQKKYKVYASIFNPAEKEKLLEEMEKNDIEMEILQIDVRDYESIESGINTIIENDGRIDILINNAGYGLTGFLEDCSTEEIKIQFETNFLGPIRLIKEVLPVMRKQRVGHIINISSVFGRISFPITPAYNATKAAISAVTEALRIEVAPFNIKVVAVEPLNIKTNFHKKVVLAEKSKNPNSPYKKYMDFYLDKMSKASHEKLSDPIVVAKKIHQIINTENPKARYIVGKGATMALVAKSLLPARLFEKMLRKNFLGV